MPSLKSARKEDAMSRKNDLSQRLKHAWSGYHLITAGAGVPRGMWTWLRDAYPDLFDQALDLWRDFCRCWRGYLDGRLDQQDFDAALMSLGRLFLRCRTAYDLAHGSEPQIIPCRRCRDCRHFLPCLEDLDGHLWGTCDKDPDGTLLWGLAGCPSWQKQKAQTPTRQTDL